MTDGYVGFKLFCNLIKRIIVLEQIKHFSKGAFSWFAINNILKLIGFQKLYIQSFGTNTKKDFMSF